jgi:spore germination protein GerM
MQAETYWVEAVGNEIVLIPQPVTVAVGLSKAAILEQAFTNLLEEQGKKGFSTIPAGTRLLGVEARSDGVHLNFSKEFAQGGGSTSMIARVGQVIFTASSLNVDEPVFISVEGQPVDAQHPLGGEGLVLTQPIMRREFVSQYPMY